MSWGLSSLLLGNVVEQVMFGDGQVITDGVGLVGSKNKRVLPNK